MTEDTTRRSRRTVLKVGATTLAGGAAVGGGLWYSSQAVLAAHADGWNADDPDGVTVNDGVIDDVVLSEATEVGIQWDKLAEEGQEAQIRIWAKPDPEDDSFDSHNSSVITEGAVNLDGTSGHETFQMADWQSSLDSGGRSFVDEHPDIDREDFEPDEEGETKETTIELGLVVRIAEGPDEGLEASPDTTAFTTSVTWAESELAAGGDGQIDVQT